MRESICPGSTQTHKHTHDLAMSSCYMGCAYEPELEKGKDWFVFGFEMSVSFIPRRKVARTEIVTHIMAPLNIENTVL